MIKNFRKDYNNFMEFTSEFSKLTTLVQEV